MSEMARRLRECVENWPSCIEGGYDPSCCRFPKSCSCEVYDPATISEERLEPHEGSRVVNESLLLNISWAERLLEAHARQSAEGWQYGTVWRFARGADELTTLGPPAGKGWVLNAEPCVEVPRWSKGDVVMQVTYWRREVPGMHMGDPKKVVHERVKWGGDPRP